MALQLLPIGVVVGRTSQGSPELPVVEMRFGATPSGVHTRRVTNIPPVAVVLTLITLIISCITLVVGYVITIGNKWLHTAARA